MLAAKKILVVDDSRVMRELLTSLLAPHCPGILVAASCKQAIEAIDANRDLELIVCDVGLPDGDGFKVLEHVASLADPKPRVILITARWVNGDSERAAALEAIGYLTKPICLPDLRVCEAGLRSRSQVDPEQRRRTLAKVWLLDPDDRSEHLLSWDLHDISMGGGLFETRGPLPIGRKLEFEILLGGMTIRAAGTVVRVQEPSWSGVGGVGVRFDWVEEEFRSALEEFIREADPVCADATYCG
jgi:CheY-like chemotaxis protein